MYDHDAAPTEEQVEKYQYLSPMLDSALIEMREFAKKKQDGIVSALKIKILNRILADLKGILSGEDSAAYLDLLSEEQLPQNSDAVVVLGQYRAVLDSFKKKHFRRVGIDSVWITKEWIEENDREYEDDSEEEDVDEEEADDDEEAEENAE